MLVCDSIRPSGMDLYYTGLPDVRYVLETHFSSSFSVYHSLFGQATCSVSGWNGGLMESTASVHYLHLVLD